MVCQRLSITRNGRSGQRFGLSVAGSGLAVGLGGGSSAAMRRTGAGLGLNPPLGFFARGFLAAVLRLFFLDALFFFAGMAFFLLRRCLALGFFFFGIVRSQFRVVVSSFSGKLMLPPEAQSQLFQDAAPGLKDFARVGAKCAGEWI
jgi:hypothetical protein